jgi:hypothetical protein
MKTVEGIYRDGRIELNQRPSAADNTRVLVTFTGEPAPSTGTVPPPPTSLHSHPAGVSQPLPDGPERDAAIEQLLAEMDAGIDFGGAPYPTREEIYNERADELERRRRKDS